MHRHIVFVLLLFASLIVSAQIREDSVILSKPLAWRFRVDSIANVYGKTLSNMAILHETEISHSGREKKPDAYSLRMMLPPTFYSSSVLQQFSAVETDIYADQHLLHMYMVNDAFANMYVNNPALVVQTDDEVEKAGTLRDDVHGSLTTDTKLSDKVVTVDLGTEMNEGVELVTRKPNFWKFPGEGSLKFTQNYFSDNWFRGGDNNYSFLCMLTLNANYDNRQNIQWENRLEARLGFQTTGESETRRSMKPTDNLLRLRTKLGYKAYKTLYYTTQVEAYTQIVPLYEHNSDDLRTSFLSPMNLTVSVGLDYKFATKNNKFNGNVYLAPCSYNMRYVDRLSLSTKHGVQEGHHAYHNFGPSITVNTYWQIAKNVSWRSRVYWISNLKYTNIEWENTFNFTINKYLSATFFVYPKFDDSSTSYKGDNGYIMMQEWLSLGLNYNW